MHGDKKPRYYAAIDLKSFFASVACVERGLDPLTTHLVVADPSRTEKTICLAVSPALKAYGLPGRARLFEVISKVREVNYQRKQNAPGRGFAGKSHDAKVLAAHPEYALDVIVARPQMSHYLKYSQKIYQIYLQYVAPEDIFPYSIDEIFCDLTSYLNMYQLSPSALATKLVAAVYDATGITATAGVGTNLYLAKIAMDILAKHAQPNAAGVRLAELDEMSYRRRLWAHQPLTDFWRIGPGYAKRLRQKLMFTMGDVARCSLSCPELLYKLFGINAEFLIDHAWGYEPVTMADIKKLHPERKSFNSGQILCRPYSFAEARVIVDEMAEAIALKMSEKGYFTDQLVLHISYDITSLDKATLHPEIPVVQDYHGRSKPKSAHGTWRLDHPTDAFNLIRHGFLELFEQYVCPDFMVRKVTLSVANLVPKSAVGMRLVQPSLFGEGVLGPQGLSDLRSDLRGSRAWLEEGGLFKEHKTQDLQAALIAIRQKYGTNAILRGANFEPGATGIVRNHQIGGHRA